MQNFTYHTHNGEMNFDGKNSAEEMIVAAEEKGFVEIGVSNHLVLHPSVENTHYSPMFFYDENKAFDCYKRHIEILRNLQSKHKIKILVGFETDFFPSAEWRKIYEKVRQELDVDYLIGTTHFIRSSDEKFMCNIYHIKYYPDLTQQSEFKEYLQNYWLNIIESIKSGYFDFIAHIDYCAIFNLCTTPEWDEYKWKVIEALAQYKQPYELNTSGYNRIDIQHPTTWMIEELNKRDVPILISDDAHSIDALGQHFERAEKLLSDIGYKNRFKLNI